MLYSHSSVIILAKNHLREALKAKTLQSFSPFMLIKHIPFTQT